MREDLQLAAFAVACGFTLAIYGCKRPFKPDAFIKGIPHDGIQFDRDGVHVWQTASGWRVAKLDGDRFPKPAPADFHRKLLPALAAGYQLATGESLPMHSA